MLLWDYPLCSERELRCSMFRFMRVLRLFPAWDERRAMSIHSDIAAQLEGIKSLKEGEKLSLGMFAAIRKDGEIRFVSNWGVRPVAPTEKE
jgi:hypothetical protein